jgi:tetratricopeptide (TPR) repeat protein
MFQLHDAIKDLPGSTAARELLVSTAQKYLGTLASEAHRNRVLQHDIAVAYAKVADIQGKAYNANTGQPKEAIASYQKSIELLEPLVAADSRDPGQRTSLAQSYLQQSRLLLLLGETKRAVAGSRRATDIYESLARTEPSVARRAVLADALRVHAMNVTLDEGNKNGLPYVYRSVSILEDLHRQRPDDIDLEYQLGLAYGTAGDLTAMGSVGPEVRRRSLDLNLKALAVDEHLVALTQSRNATYARSLASDRVNLCAQFTEIGEYERAIELCRAAQPLLQSLRADDRNAQGRVDMAGFGWNMAYAYLGAKRMDEAEPILLENLRTLPEIARENDTVQIQYLLAASEQGMGAVHAYRAERSPPGSAAQLRGWRTAKAWYEKSIPRFEAVGKQVTLDYPDRTPMDEAIAGLKASTEAVAHLEGKHETSN